MKHLTEREQNEWLLGARAPAAEVHLAACARCRAAVDRMEGALGQFRAASLRWSEERSEQARHALPRRPAARPLRHAWAAGCAAAALLATAGLVQLRPRSPAPAPQPAAGVSDDALLERVDWQVSGSVPEAMQPLAGGRASSEAAR